MLSKRPYNSQYLKIDEDEALQLEEQKYENSSDIPIDSPLSEADLHQLENDQRYDDLSEQLHKILKQLNCNKNVEELSDFNDQINRENEIFWINLNDAIKKFNCDLNILLNNCRDLAFIVVIIKILEMHQDLISDRVVDNLEFLQDYVCFNNGKDNNAAVDRFTAAVKLVKSQLARKTYHAQETIRLIKITAIASNSEKVARGLIVGGAGLGTGTTIVGITISLTLGTTALILSSSASCVLGIVVCFYFYKAFRDSDINFLKKVNKYQREIEQLQATITDTIKKCEESLTYLLSNNLNMIDAIAIDCGADYLYLYEKLHEYTQFRKPTELVDTTCHTSAEITPVDWLLIHHPLANTCRGESISNSDQDDSPYRRALSRKYWGPSLSFINMVGLGYGIYSIILTLVPVIAIGIGTLGAGLLAIGISIAIGVVIALVHRSIIKRNEHRELELKKIKESILIPMREENLKLQDLQQKLFTLKQTVKHRDFHDPIQDPPPPQNEDAEIKTAFPIPAAPVSSMLTDSMQHAGLLQNSLDTSQPLQRRIRFSSLKP